MELEGIEPSSSVTFHNNVYNHIPEGKTRKLDSNQHSARRLRFSWPIKLLQVKMGGLRLQLNP